MALHRNGVTSGLLLASLLSLPAWCGTWTEAAPTNVPRQYPGLARLPDGRILAVTGHPLKGQSLASAEIFDPTANTWTPTGPLNVARNGVEPGGLIVLPGGQVLIVGGGTAARSVKEAELFDPTTQTWSLTGPMNEARSNHSTTLLADGRVLVVGGIDWATEVVRSSAELYDSATGRWTLLAPTSGPRTNHSAVLLNDGRVLIVGGASTPDFSDELSSAEIFNPMTLAFRATGAMHEARRAFRALKMNDGRVIAVGGSHGTVGDPAAQLSSVEVFDPRSESWGVVAPLIEGRWGPDVAVLSDGSILVTGGMYGRVGRRRTAEIFNPETGVWSSAGALKQGRNGHRSIRLDDGRILIVGGFSGTDYLTSCEVFEE